MRLLLFSDIHVNKHYCELIVAKSAEADIVVGAGDFGSLRHGISKTINWLSSINKPSVVVPGNAESFEELKEACVSWPSASVLHGSSIKLSDITFYGLGGGVPITPFGSWSYDFSEEEAHELLLNCPKGSVLVSHSPPYGMLDLSSNGKHLGSISVRKVVEEKAPTLVVCGHIHESGGKMTRFRVTDIVNAGPTGVFFEMDKSRC
jgi:Icc-related predicted phosphoesterase